MGRLATDWQSSSNALGVVAIYVERVEHVPVERVDDVLEGRHKELEVLLHYERVHDNCRLERLPQLPVWKGEPPRTKPNQTL